MNEKQWKTMSKQTMENNVQNVSKQMESTEQKSKGNQNKAKQSDEQQSKAKHSKAEARQANQSFLVHILVHTAQCPKNTKRRKSLQLKASTAKLASTNAPIQSMPAM